MASSTEHSKALEAALSRAERREIGDVSTAADLLDRWEREHTA
jgi:hypothetical protein